MVVLWPTLEARGGHQRGSFPQERAEYTEGPWRGARCPPVWTAGVHQRTRATSENQLQVFSLIFALQCLIFAP